MKGGRILVIDDEPMVREAVGRMLVAEGYAVDLAADGNAALVLLDAAPPDVILLDLMMPGMNGWDFVAKLRERPEYANVPVIIHSSAPDRAPAGVDSVLRKPLSLTNLLAVVKKYCGAV